MGSLVFAVVVAAVGFVVVRRAGHHLDRQAADAKLCTTAASGLELVNPNMAAGVPDVAFTTSRTTAGQLASELGRTGSSPHPWDREPRDTVVIRCQSGNVVWLVDGKGHAARMPTR